MTPSTNAAALRRCTLLTVAALLVFANSAHSIPTKAAASATPDEPQEREIASSPHVRAVSLPDGARGIGFDDLRYSPDLHRVLVPSGRSGLVNLIDPDNLAVTSIGGFSKTAQYSGGHDDGPTSVDEARGTLYVTDRTNQSVSRVNLANRSVAGSTKLAHGPDYVRYVAATNELWVTEPGAHQIEVFAITKDGSLQAKATIPVANGPESLVIDTARGRAYTHRWQKTSLAIDVHSHAIVAEWPNGCAASRGIALDEKRGLLLSACKEGKLTALDLNHDGKLVSSIERGSGFDVIGYNSKLGHVYLAGGTCRCLVVVGVSPSGQLTVLESAPAPASTHCVIADDGGHAWICDPKHGRVLRIDDRHAASLVRQPTHGGDIE